MQPFDSDGVSGGGRFGIGSFPAELDGQFEDDAKVLGCAVI